MLFCKGFWKQHLLKRKKIYLWPSCPTYENMSYRNKITKSHWFMYNGFIRGFFFFFRYKMPGKVIEHLIDLYNLKYKTLHFQSSLIQTAKKFGQMNSSTELPWKQLVSIYFLIIEFWCWLMKKATVVLIAKVFICLTRCSSFSSILVN